ncbi:hypothetical protein, partial [Staphylococcus aureus]|uniref:hypothetical protein n=1 Tax=Staphylococcus aureus TaxID=1280 RepID=UPI0038B3B5BC
MQEIIGRRADKSVSWEYFLKSRITAYLKENNYEYPSQLVILVIALASLQLFVQNNWTGPVTTELEVLP